MLLSYVLSSIIISVVTKLFEDSALYASILWMIQSETNVCILLLIAPLLCLNNVMKGRYFS